MRLLAIALMLSSVTVFAACPDLSGKYAVCRSTTGESPGSTDMIVTQATKNGVTTYTIVSTDDETQERTTQSLKADGKTYTEIEDVPETDMKMKTLSTVTCVGNTIQESISAFIGDDELANVNAVSTKSGNTLTTVMTGTIFGSDINDTIICE